jgi:transcriptional regulator of acetoin/glycerol metabolism
MGSSQQHIAAVLAVAHAPRAPLPTADNTSIIHRSWYRCVREFNLDPAHPGEVPVESASTLRERRGEIEEYLAVARAGMEQLFKCVSELGYVLLLTDSRGVTIDYIGNDMWDRQLKAAGLYLGVNWAEANAGTNGVGTCIAEQRPVACHRDDHFFHSNVGLSCNAVPLFDPEGGFIGVLNVSLLAPSQGNDSPHLAHRLTSLYGQMIEDTLFVRHFQQHSILRLGKSLVDIAGEPMLAFDRDGVIVGANTSARKQLSSMHGHDGRLLVGRRLTDVFHCTLDEIARLTRLSSAFDRVPLSTFDLKVFSASVIAPQVLPRSPGNSRTEHNDTLPTDDTPLDELAGDDKNLQRIIDQAKRLVNKQVTILLQGETGTGKEVFARALHDSSSRSKEPFIAVNCAAFPESLIESELFGYASGAFTGARSKGKRGLIAQSDGGTLFLDEIGDMPLPLQTRLLRVLAEKEVLPLGAEKPISVRLTVIAASHRDLRKQIAAGTFREDLYYRLCGATLAIVPLRDRSDKEFIIDKIVREEAAKLGTVSQVEPEALNLLLRHSWPGNIRQLRNVLRYALAISDGQGIFVDHLPSELLNTADPLAVDGTQALPAEETNHLHGNYGRRELLVVLQRHKWNITTVAKELGVYRTTVYRQMQRFNIVDPRKDSMPH